MRTPNILIVDGLSRNGLAVARGLKMGGPFRIHVMSRSSGSVDFLSRVFKSKSVDFLHFSSSSFHEDTFTETVKSILDEFGIDAVIPAGQEAAVAVSRAKPELEKYSKILIEGHEKLMDFADKGRTASVAAASGIPIPETFLPRDLEEVRELAAASSYPVVIKARTGAGGRGIRIAENSREMLEIYRGMSWQCPGGGDSLDSGSLPIVQQHIPGKIHDALVFCLNGEVKAGLTQQRIVTRPPSGGIGILNITTRDTRLLDHARALALHTGWNGVMMLEFKVDSRDGGEVLLEVNPRFWGTTWLSICAGVNFPLYLVQEAFGEKPSYPVGYREGLACRWLLDEIGGIFSSPRGFPEIAERTRVFLSGFRYRECAYDLMLSDPNPAFGTILVSLHDCLRRALRVRA